MLLRASFPFTLVSCRSEEKALARISHGEPKTVAPASLPAVRRVSRPSETRPHLEFLFAEPHVRNAD
jgi:hypothetical protein